MASKELLIKSMIEKSKINIFKVSFLIISQTGVDRGNVVWWFLAYTRSRSWHRLNSFAVKCLYAWIFLSTKATRTFKVVAGEASAVKSLQEDFTSRPGSYSCLPRGEIWDRLQHPLQPWLGAHRWGLEAITMVFSALVAELFVATHVHVQMQYMHLLFGMACLTMRRLFVFPHRCAVARLQACVLWQMWFLFEPAGPSAVLMTS